MLNDFPLYQTIAAVSFQNAFASIFPWPIHQNLEATMFWPGGGGVVYVVFPQNRKCLLEGNIVLECNLASSSKGSEPMEQSSREKGRSRYSGVSGTKGSGLNPSLCWPPSFTFWSPKLRTSHMAVFGNVNLQRDISQDQIPWESPNPTWRLSL